MRETFENLPHEPRDDSDAGEFEAKVRPSEGPLHLKVGNVEVKQIGDRFRFLVNGQVVRCRSFTLRWSPGRPWDVDLEFFPVGPDGRFLGPGPQLMPEE